MINCEDMGKGGFVVRYTNRLGLKPQANSESPLKRTQIFSFSVVLRRLLLLALHFSARRVS